MTPTNDTATSGTPALHLAIRLALELALLAGGAVWGWSIGDGGARGTVAALVAAFAGLWFVVGTPGDPGRGPAPVAIPGWTRLLLELGLVGLAAYGIWTSWSRAAAETLLTVFALHYAVTWERSWWLLRMPSKTGNG
ncbi:MAG: DUF2568 domain-containing protein [Dactylosporangium sp.]|nr:DUF2568 domain-containing protein [Dactylosporangium sp.]